MRVEKDFPAYDQVSFYETARNTSQTPDGFIVSELSRRLPDGRQSSHPPVRRGHRQQRRHSHPFVRIFPLFSRFHLSGANYFASGGRSTLVRRDEAAADEVWRDVWPRTWE